MSNEQSYRAPRRRGPRGPMGGGMMPGEKAKDFKYHSSKFHCSD